MKTERNMNLDLMKIISMLMIILWHFLLHGNILMNTSGKTHIILLYIMHILVVHVNSFVLTTGYFQYKKQFKISKFLSINNTMWFYKALIAVIFIIFGLSKLTEYEIFKNFMPFNYNDYWFIMIYLFLYLCSPLLNIIIRNIDEQKHRLIVIIMFITISILPTLSNQEIYNNGNGYSLINFIFLYFIGSYISKYDIKIFKNNKKNILIFLLLAGLNLLINRLFVNINSENFYILRLKNSILNTQFGYLTPTNVIQSVIYFCIFKNITIKKPIIEKIAKTTIGIYLIHDNELVRKYMYVNIFNLPYSTMYSKGIIIKVLIYVVITFIICSLLEMIRQFLVKKICKLKIFIKIKEKIKNIIKCLKYDILKVGNKN